MAVVLAVDVGTTSAKAMLFADDGTQVGTAVTRPTPIGRDGLADAEAVADVVDALVDETVGGLPVEPDAVALSTIWHTLVGVGNDGRPTTELSTWLDGRAGEAAAALRRALGDDVRVRTGAPVHPSLPPARLAWLRENRPDAFAATRRWCSLAEVLATRWFDKAVGPSSSVASASGLYDQRRSIWDPDMLAVLGIDEGALATVDDGPRGLGSGYAKRWPSLAGVPWFAAIGDGAAALVGSECLGPDRAALTVGTSAAVRVATTREDRLARPLPRSLFGYLLDAERSVVGAARSNGGNVVAWATDALRVAGDDAVAAATAGREPGAHGLVVDSSLVTERSPAWPLSSAGRVEGVRRDTTAVDVLQGLVEDTALGIAAAVEALERWAGRRTVVLGGGAVRFDGWCRLLADVLGRPLVRSSVVEASARGAAIVALESLGLGLEVVPAEQRTIDPDSARVAAFDRLKEGHPLFGASWNP